VRCIDLHSQIWAGRGRRRRKRRRCWNMPSGDWFALGFVGNNKRMPCPFKV